MNKHPSEPIDKRIPHVCATPFALFFIILFLAACGPAEETSDTPTITLAASLLPSEQQAYVSILNDFTEQTGIEVELVAQQYEQILTAIEAEAQAGRGELDLVELDVDRLGATRPFMQPLDDLLTISSALADRIAADAWNAGRFGDPSRLYFVPHRLFWQALIYNAEALPEPPADWAALLAVAREHPGAIGFKAARYEGLVCDLFPFLWQAGADPLQPDSPAARETMRFLRDLAPAFNSAVRSYKEQSALDALKFGEIVLHANWPFAVSQLAEAGMLPTRFRTAPLPAGPAGRATVLGGGYLAVPATAPHPQAAAILIKYLTSADVQQRLVAELGWFPIRSEGWNALSAEDREHYSGFLAMRDDVRARPAVPYYTEVSRLWQDAFYAIVFEGEPIDATLVEMQHAIDRLAANAAEAAP